MVLNYIGYNKRFKFPTFLGNEVLLKATYLLFSYSFI